MFLSEIPEVAAMWHPIKNGDRTPDVVKAGSQKIAWWVCPTTGADYDRAVYLQVRAGVNSPYEANRRVLAGYNDLATIHPEIAALWHPTRNGELTPEMVTPGMATKVWWVCPVSGGEYQRKVDGQVIAGTATPFTTNRKVLPGFNDLATTHPDVAAMWHPTKNGELTPEQVHARSKSEVWWVCPASGGEYPRKVVNQVQSGATSPYMTGQSILVGFNDLASVRPDVAALWHPTRNGDLTPEMVTLRSGREVWWVCPTTGLDYDRMVFEQVNTGTRTPFTAKTNARPIPGVNDLATTHPDAAALWHPTKNGELDPTMVSAGSPKKVWWLCPTTGASYDRHIWEQVKYPDSPYVTNKQVLAGYNDLETLYPEVAALWHPTKNGDVTPDSVIPNNKSYVWWLCPASGEPYNRQIVEQVKSGPISPFVTGRLLVGFNDLATTHPDIAAAWHPTKNGERTAQDVSRGCQDKVWWVCPQTGREFMRGISDAVRYGVLAPTVSSGEQEVADFVESILPDDTEILRRDRSIISPKELDIVVPDRSVAIEFNGIYWHSEEQGKDRRYHHNKWVAAHDAGLRLITVWEDEWRDRRSVVESMLRHKLGVDKSRTVGARKCRVVTLDHRTAARFLDQHHIQGSATGSVYLGLRDRDGVLVAVSVWRKLKSELFLDRYATSCTVPGGMGKLLKSGCDWGRSHDCDVVVTFSDHEVSDGGLYDRLGFTRDRELKPDYRYVYGGVRCHKFGFRLKRFRNDPELLWQEGLSERQLAELNSIPRVWDAGKTRHVMEIPAGERTVAGLF